MKNQKKAYIFAMLAVLLWSSVATAFKISLKYLSIFELLFISTIVSWIVLGVLTIYTKEYKYLKTIDKSQIVKMLILGFINPFAYYLVLFKAYDILPAQEAQALNYTWALTLTYLSVFILNKPLLKRDIISGIICYIGVFIISTRGELLLLNFSNLTGVSLALFSTLLWSFYWIYNTKWTTYPTLGLFLNFTSGVFFIGVLAIFFANFDTLNIKGVLSATYVGIFEMGITFFLWLQALRFTQNTSKIANLIFLSPFLSLIFISYFLHEKILLSTFIGLCFIIGGLIYQQKKKKN